MAKAAAAVGSVAAPTAAAAVGTGSSATHPLPLPPPEEEATGNDDADGDEDVAADAAVMAMAAAAKGKATRKDTAVVAKKPAAAKYAALKRPAAAKQPTNKRPAAAGMGGGAPPRTKDGEGQVRVAHPDLPSHHGHRPWMHLHHLGGAVGQAPPLAHVGGSGGFRRVGDAAAGSSCMRQRR